ncbi:hypothetical protein Hamer_G004024 [Homarus americanus]|uniref:Uncharacterized protein n=1 Tax=Homarus americanus TaxID=6706 RepID=A0A8J5TNK3_HOMAM|nr:hypothetical protein Hamer_G004024 [Homarus americanus]
MNGVWHPLWPDAVQTFKGFTKDKDLREIVLISKYIREDPGFQEITEDVVELQESMDDPLMIEEARELAKINKNREEEEESKMSPQP